MSEPVKHTEGPWRWEYNPDQKRLKLCGGVPRYDLTLLDFVRCGMQGGIARFRDCTIPRMNVMELPGKWAVPEPGREHHAEWFALIDHPDARLIASAPELLAELKRLQAWFDRETELVQGTGTGSTEGELIDEVIRIKALVAKVENGK